MSLSNRYRSHGLPQGHATGLGSTYGNLHENSNGNHLGDSGGQFAYHGDSHNYDYRSDSSNSRVDPLSDPDNDYWSDSYSSISQHAGNYYHDYETHIRRIKSIDEQQYTSSVSELKEAGKEGSGPLGSLGRFSAQKHSSTSQSTPSQPLSLVSNSAEISGRFTSVAAQFKSLNTSFISSHFWKREWSADASRLRYYFGGKCMTKVRRGATGTSIGLSPSGEDDMSVQEISLLCCQSNPLMDIPRVSSVDASGNAAPCREMVLPWFFGSDLIEDVSIMEDHDPTDDYLCFYIVFRNDRFVFRSYCVDRQVFIQRARIVNDFSKARRKILISEELPSMREELKRKNPLWKLVVGPKRRTNLADYHLTNPVGVIPYKNGTHSYVLVIAQDIHNDPLRTTSLDNDSSDIDMTSYYVGPIAKMNPGANIISDSQTPQKVIRLSRVGVPPYVAYFLSGTIRDEVYRSQPMFTCSDSNSCLFTFLFGLFLSIELPSSNPSNASSFSISVVDFREHFPKLNLESLFTKRIIFKKSWIPPLMRFSNDGTYIALTDSQHHRVILFKRGKDNTHEIFGEYFENRLVSHRGSDSSKGPRDLPLDMRFVEIESVRGRDTLVQILYRGKVGTYTRFYAVSHRNPSQIISLIPNIFSFFQERWRFLILLISITIAFIVNERIIWTRNQQRNSNNEGEEELNSVIDDIVDTQNQ